MGPLGDWLRRRWQVEHLEAALVVVAGGFLATQRKEREAAQVRLGQAGDGVGHSGAESGHHNPRTAGKATVGCSHEGRVLFVPADDKLDAMIFHGLEEHDCLLAGKAVDGVDVMGDQCGGNIFGGGRIHCTATVLSFTKQQPARMR